MTVCLVTGAGGFIGSKLVSCLLQKGCNVVALSSLNSNKISLKYPNYPGVLTTFAGDILNQELLASLFQKYSFDFIYHFAAQSSPPKSWLSPALTMNINFGGSVNLLEHAAKNQKGSTVVLASSSAVYSPVTSEIKIDETTYCEPQTPYGISKLAQDHFAKSFSKNHEIDVRIIRPFFIIGPKKTGDVCSDWARNIVALERGQKGDFTTGNVQGVERDFLDVDDAVVAIETVAARGRSGEIYNICSGVGVPLVDLLSMLSELSRVNIAPKTSDTKVRKTDDNVRVGDNRKISELGWKRKKSLEQSLCEIVEFWRNNH